jgi:hypothetical protein
MMIKGLDMNLQRVVIQNVISMMWTFLSIGSLIDCALSSFLIYKQEDWKIWEVAYKKMTKSGQYNILHG